MKLFHYMREGGLVATFAVVLSIFLLASPANAQDWVPDTQAKSADTCRALLKTDFAGLPDAPTAIMSAERVAAAPNKPAHCRVTGIIAPQIQFELRLPDDWNNRYFQSGCGGFCGFIEMERCAVGQARGFAVAMSNLGHVGNTWAAPVWAANEQLRKDYGGRGTHVLAVASKAIIASYYGNKPRYSYLQGCSTGGREGFASAQNFPEDFDGIVAGDPAFAGRLGLWNTWIAHHLMTANNKPVFAHKDLELLHNAVMKACDKIDGLQDGIITDPRQCKFDPAPLQCRPGSTENCLSAQQIASARALYDGARNSAGVLLHPGSAPLGSELDWNGPMYAEISKQALRFLAFPEIRPTLNYRDFNWNTDVAQMEAATTIYDPVAPRAAPNLTAFQARGGKIIAYHGESDLGVPPGSTIDYYAQVWTRMGGLPKTREWFRLFMVPGMFHCRGGDAPNEFDMLTAIVEWVEKGRAPDGIVAEQHDHTGVVKRTRPLYAYPNVARYKGKGDQNVAANWTIKVVSAGDDRADWVGKPAQ